MLLIGPVSISFPAITFARGANDVAGVIETEFIVTSVLATQGFGSSNLITPSTATQDQDGAR